MIFVRLLLCNRSIFYCNTKPPPEQCLPRRSKCSTYRPFTRKKAIELETEKVKELKLDTIWNPYTVFRRNDGYNVFRRNDGYKRVSFSKLLGKRVMLVLEKSDVNYNFSKDSAISRFSLMLKGRYLQTRGTDDEFEVLHIIIDDADFSTGEHVYHDFDDIEWLLSHQRELYYIPKFF